MNGQSSLATGVRQSGITTSLDDLSKALHRLDEVTAELNERISPVLVNRPPTPCEKQQAIGDVERCTFDARVQEAISHVHTLIGRTERTITELRI